MTVLRPTISDFSEIAAYMQAMLDWRRTVDRSFSVRRQVAAMGCSPTLISQIMRGRRSLTRDRVEAVAKLLTLNEKETAYLDSWVARQRRPLKRKADSEPLQRLRAPTNHLLTDWLHVYVKDARRLKGFRPDAAVVHRLLGGIASLGRIGRSIDFLLREGFWRRTLEGDIVESEVVTTTTVDVPVAGIRSFHKRALDIAKRGIDLHPPQERHAMAVVLPLNRASFLELKALLSDMQERLTEFAESHPCDNETLYQVVINFCPIGGGDETLH